MTDAPIPKRAAMPLPVPKPSDPPDPANRAVEAGHSAEGDARDSIKLRHKPDLVGPHGEPKTLAEIEREVIEHRVVLYAGRLTQVARSLNISRSTLYRKLQGYERG